MRFQIPDSDWPWQLFQLTRFQISDWLSPFTLSGQISDSRFRLTMAAIQRHLIESGNLPKESHWINFYERNHLEYMGIQRNLICIRKDFRFQCHIPRIILHERQSTFQISDSDMHWLQIPRGRSQQILVNSRFQIPKPPFKSTRRRRGRWHIPDSDLETWVERERGRFRFADSRILATQIPVLENRWLNPADSDFEKD